MLLCVYIQQLVYMMHTFSHVVKAGGTIALSTISRMPEISPSPSPCSAYPLQGNSSIMYAVNIDRVVVLINSFMLSCG